MDFSSWRQWELLQCCSAELCEELGAPGPMDPIIPGLWWSCVCCVCFGEWLRAG